jgi:hypothetical protein
MDTLPKFVATRLREVPQPTESHPDANLLAAFAEQSLVGRERTRVVEHIAACGDCREAVALSLPATEIANLPVFHRASRIGWLTWPGLGWAVLAAGILIVASIGIQQYSRRQEKTVTFNVTPSGSIQRDASPGPAELQPPLPQVLAPPGDAQKVSARGSSLPAPVHEGLSVIARGQKATAVIPHSVGKVQSEGAGLGADGAAEGQSQLAQNRPDVPLPGQAFDDLNVVKAKDPTPEQAASDNPSAQTSPSMFRSQRWGITTAGALQRSLDDGNTWENVDPSPGDQDELQQKSKKAEAARNSSLMFRAVAASGLEVWAGASDGILYHSSDGGNRWALTAVADSAVILTADITGIQFADALHGKIATSTGQLWTTSDSGQTWHRQK